MGRVKIKKRNYEMRNNISYQGMNKFHLLLFAFAGWLPIVMAILVLIPFYFDDHIIELKIIISLFNLYILPALICRLLLLNFEGKRKIKYLSKDFFIWWYTMRLQILFNRFPSLDEFLRLVPVVYGNWLKLWGAKVGIGVIWSPHVLVIDRPFINIGNNVVLGHGTTIVSHSFTYRDKIPLLYFGVPIIEDKAILGGLSKVGVGAKIYNGELVPLGTAVFPFRHWYNGKSHFSSKWYRQ
jgi:acetyltransferase-like isoleucine patch superfamily enzyme